jgi:hypothetical protein
MINKTINTNIFHYFFISAIFYFSLIIKIDFLRQNYILGLIVLSLFSYLISNIKISINKNYLKIIELFLIPLLILFYFIILIISPQTKVFNIYFREIFYTDFIFIFLILILALIKTTSYKTSFSLKKDFFLFFFLFLIINILLSSFLVVDEFNPYNYVSPLNFGAAINSIVRAINGEGANINFINQYGGYANFLSPILKSLFNEPKILHITLLLAVIFFFLNFLLFIVIAKITKDYFLSFFGIIALLYFYLFIMSPWPGELYLANAPIRFFSPVLTIFAFYLNFKKKINIFFTSFLSFFLFTLIFWNFETGLVSYFSFIICSLLIFYYQNENSFYKTFTFLLFIVIAALFSYITLQYFSYLDYKNFINLTNVISASMEYAGSGRSFYQIKEISNFSFIFIIINILNFYIGLKNIKEKLNCFINNFVFSLSMLNFGVMSYYFSKIEHPQSFFPCSYIIILIIIINIYQIKKKNLISNNFFYGQILFLKYFVIFFLAISFFVNALYDDSFKQKINLFDIFFPDYSKKNSHYIFIGNNKLIQNWIKYEQITSNPDNLPPWTRKKNIIENEIKFFLKDNKKKYKALILSHNDHYFNSHFNILSKLKKTNYAHEFNYSNEWEIYFSLIKNNYYEFVIIDYEYIEPFPTNPEIIYKLINYLEINYQKKDLFVERTLNKNGNDKVSIFFPKNK